MISKKSRTEVREKKHMKLRNRFKGTAERPRLAVYRSNMHMYAQIIDDDTHTKLFNLRFQNATNQLENTGRIKEVRRNIARIKTVITQKAKAAE